MIGTVKGYQVTNNRNSDHKVVMLQVQLSDSEDIQSVELYNPFGEKSIPQNEQRVLILQLSRAWKIAIAIDDKIDPSDLNDGEKKLYSLDPSGAIAAFMTLTNTGELFLNGETDYAVRFLELKAGFDQLKSDFNNHIHTETGASTSTPTVPSAASIDDSKVDEVRLS